MVLPFFLHSMTHLLLPLNPLGSRRLHPHARNFHKPIAETSAQTNPEKLHKTDNQ